MAIRPFTPESGDLKSDDHGIILLNHVGSSVREDTGRDAQHLANYLGMTVIAVDRPGSGRTFLSRELRGRLSYDYVKEVGKLSLSIDREASRSGVKRLVVAGRSAGATGALALTAAENLALEGVYAAEPVGMYDTTVSQGRRDYADYLRRQKELLEFRSDDTSLVRPHGSGVSGFGVVSRAVDIGLSTVSDHYHNAGVWSQSIAFSAAHYIAGEMPQVDLQLDFAALSMSGPQKMIDRLRCGLSAERAAVANMPDASVTQVPDTVHASFDNRDFFGSRMDRFMLQAGITTS